MGQDHLYDHNTNSQYPSEKSCKKPFEFQVVNVDAKIGQMRLANVGTIEPIQARATSSILKHVFSTNNSTVSVTRTIIIVNPNTFRSLKDFFFALALKMTLFRFHNLDYLILLSLNSLSQSGRLNFTFIV